MFFKDLTVVVSSKVCCKFVVISNDCFNALQTNKLSRVFSQLLYVVRYSANTCGTYIHRALIFLFLNVYKILTTSYNIQQYYQYEIKTNKINQRFVVRLKR